MSLALALLAPAAAVFAAAVLRGFTGFGFGLAAVPLLSFVMPPAQAVVMAVGLQFCGGLTDIPAARKLCDGASLRWLILGAVFGSPLGTAALAYASAPMARLAIAFICALGTAALGLGFKLPDGARSGTAVSVGVLSGLFNGLAAMPGPPVVAYYLSSHLPAAVVRASLMMFFLATSIASLISLGFAGLLEVKTALQVLTGLPVMVGGTWLGHRMFLRAGGGHHRLVSILVLGALALLSSIQGFAELAASR